MLKICWKALQASIVSSDKIIIIHDEVSQSTIDWMIATSNTNYVELVEVPKHEWSYHLHTMIMLKNLENKCLEFPNELHYIVEDDYLHTKDAIRILENTLDEWDSFAVSYDYPDRYLSTDPKCTVLLGVDRHWRTVTSATMTALAKGTTWLRYMPQLYAAGPTSNDSVFETIFIDIRCISPLPGVASHMTDKHISPLVDWESIWNSQDIS